ncbi:MAG: c-type cytochrome biogenesis protein CcmI [Deinococcales bacterium]
MLPWYILLAFIALLLLVFALLPLRDAEKNQFNIRSKRDELEDELNQVYAQIAELEKQFAAGEFDAQDHQRFLQRDEARAAKLLERIEQAPTETAPQKSAPTNLKSGIITFVITAVVLGALSAFAVPQLESWALRPGEREMYAQQKELLYLGKELNALSDKENAKPESERKPLPLDLLIKYGDVAWELNRYDDAAKGYGAALRQFTDSANANPGQKPSPENIKALSRYGQILFFGGENDQALEVLRTAAKLNDAEAWLTIGNILFSVKNDPKGAIAAWETFQKINTDKAFGARVPDLIAAAKNRLREAEPGAKIFAQSCAGCHGAEAQGLVGPNLKTSKNARSKDFVRRQLQTGSRNQQMPAFKNIQGKELEGLLQYVTGLK